MFCNYEAKKSPSSLFNKNMTEFLNALHFEDASAKRVKMIINESQLEIHLKSGVKIHKMNIF